jgi:hypothetical protein
MSQNSNDEWKALRDRFEELRQQSELDLEEIIDAQSRQRFGEMIARSVIGASKSRQE